MSLLVGNDALLLSLVIGLTLIASLHGQRLGIGAQCRLHSGQKGVCHWIDDCESAQIELESDITPVLCSTVHHRKIVCCENSGPNIADRLGEASTESSETQRKRLTSADLPEKYKGKKSWEKCIEYANEVYQPELNPSLLLNHDVSYVSQCVLSAQGLIIGGVKCAPKEFPHMAALGFADTPRAGSWLCGGSLISERFILTAAHCVFARGRGPVRWARLGDLNLAYDNDTSRPADYAVEKSIRHPRHNSSLQYHDIALLRLKTDVTFNGFVRPACLSTEKLTPKGGTVTATGWGLLESTSDVSSDDLMKVELRFETPARCSDAYRPEPKLPRGFTRTSMICAGDVGR